jgi:hypothetical protein
VLYPLRINLSIDSADVIWLIGSFSEGKDVTHAHT